MPSTATTMTLVNTNKIIRFIFFFLSSTTHPRQVFHANGKGDPSGDKSHVSIAHYVYGNDDPSEHGDGLRSWQAEHAGIPVKCRIFVGGPPTGHAQHRQMRKRLGGQLVGADVGCDPGVQICY